MAAPLRLTRIAILGTSTTSLLTPIVQALAFRDRIQADYYEGIYGAWEQEIIDQSSGLYRFSPQILFIVNHWRDLNLPAVEDPWVEQQVNHRKELWKRISETCGSHVVQHGFDFPAQEPYGYLGNSLPGGRTQMIETLNRRMREEAPPYVSILDLDAVSRQVGTQNWQDAQSWAMFKQHPATAALPTLAEHMLAHIRAVIGLTCKVMVLDLDNTLWKGVIGEDGLDGIEIGLGTPAGEASCIAAILPRSEKARILLAVNSKNNLEDAKLPFEKHSHMH